MGGVSRALIGAVLAAIAFSASGAKAQENEWVRAGIRPQVFEDALSAWAQNQSKIENQRYLTIVDYGLPSDRPRLFVLDHDKGTLSAYLVAHGKGSDPDHTGHATRFSNKPGSEMSSLGAYLTGPTYQGQHGISLRLFGLESTNDKAAERAIVVHGAEYVSPERKVQGRSWGCPAVEQRFASAIIGKVRGGSLLYIHN